MRIITVSDSYSHFDKAIAEYAKRLGDAVQVVTIKPEKLAESTVIPRRETERIVEYLKKEKLRVVLLDEFGKRSTTADFAASLRARLDRAENFAFVIGGAFGVERELLSPYVDAKFALSDMTLPHSLALLVLLEQVYRAREIWKGSKYHHGTAF